MAEKKRNEIIEQMKTILSPSLISNTRITVYKKLKLSLSQSEKTIGKDTDTL